MQNTSNKIDVKVLGTATSAHQMAVSVIHDYLTKANVDFSLEEVTDVSVFIEQGLDSIPSVDVNGNLIALQQNGSFNKSLRSALNVMLKKVNYGEMEKFIVPVDFSDVSINAFIYGHRLASLAGAVTKAVHVYFPASKELSQSTVIDVDFAEIRKGYLNEFVNKMDVDWGSDLLSMGLIDKEYRTGFPGEEILDSVAENDAQLIVMGTTGDSSRIKKWFGSVSTKIMNDAKVPVLLVPEKAKYKGVEKVMFAFDDITLDLSVLDDLVGFAGAFDAKIYLVHMQNESNPDPGFYLQEQLGKRYDTDKIELVSLHDSDVVLALSDFATQESIDVIAMATEQRTFFNRIFHDSVTKRMSMHSEIPLLVLKGKE